MARRRALNVQRKCGRCHKTVPDEVRTCSCGYSRWAYVARWRDPRGRERSKSFQTRTKAEACKIEKEGERDAGTYRDPRRGVIRFVDFYVKTRGVMAESLEPTTLAKYDRTWRLYVAPILGDIALNRITRADVRTVRDRAAKRSPWQATEALKLTRSLLNRAMDDDEIVANPAARIKAPETRRQKPKVLTPAQVTRIVAALPERFRALVILDAYSALRWSEVVALKRDDVDIDGRTVTVDERLVEVEGRFHWGKPKTAESARTVHLPDVVIVPLVEHLLRFPPLRDDPDPDCEGLIFYGEKGGPVRRHVFRKAWQAASAEAGIEGVRPEWLRHSGASLAYAATHDIKAVAARLGHTSTRMVDTIYVQLYEEASRDVADAIDMMVRRSTEVGSS